MENMKITNVKASNLKHDVVNKEYLDIEISQFNTKAKKIDEDLTKIDQKIDKQLANTNQKIDKLKDIDDKLTFQLKTVRMEFDAYKQVHNEAIERGKTKKISAPRIFKSLAA